MPETQRPRLLFSIDVEEDMPGWQIAETTSVGNARGLAALAALCREFGVRPTYLCTYPMVTEPSSARILRDLLEAGDCEIGTHLHAWNCPPFDGVPGRDGVDERTVPYYQFELDAARVRAKLETLHGAITALTGTEPVSFRAGRYGIDVQSLRELIRLGYEVDTSVTPLSEHTDDGGPDFRGAPQLPYRPSADDLRRRGDLGILEIPVSVALTHRLPNLFRQAYVHIPKRTRIRGLLSRDFLRVVDFAWLYPVRFDFDLMSRAARTLLARRAPS